MSNKFHKDLVLDDIHALVARDYADISARDADTDFQVAGNLDKAVAIQSPTSIYLLTSVGPAVWLELTSTGTSTLAGILSGGNTTGGSDLIVNSGDDLLVDGGMNVGGVGAPGAEASIDLTGTDEALFLNRLTTTQRDALTPVAGMFIYNSTLNISQFYNGTAWSAISGGDVFGPVSSTNNAVPRFDGTGGKTLQDSNVLITDAGVMTITGQLASRQSTATIEIFSMSDFPAPSSGVITLPSGKYSIRAPVSTADRFEIGANSSVEIQVEDSRATTFTYTGTGTMFTAVGAIRLTFDHANITCTGNGAQLFDITGGNLTIAHSQITMTGTGTTFGVIIDAGEVIISFLTLNGQTDGLTVQNIDGLNMQQVIMAGDQTGSNALITILGAMNFIVNTDGLIITPGPSENVFFIDPTVEVQIDIHNTTDLGTNGFFKTGTTGPIASFTDVATGTTAATVTDNSGAALFNDTGHGLVVGETVVHTTFTESSYNGTFVVTAADANTYEAGLAFVSTDSGLFETTTTQVNDVGHGLSNGQTLSIFGTVDFGGGYKIFNVQTDTFEITLGKAFPGSETTGNWDTGSLDQESKFISAMFNGSARDSHSIGDVVVGSNSVATVISTQNTFVDLNLNNSAALSTITSRFVLTNSDNGEIRYDGLHPATFVVRGFVAASSAGGGQRFNFRLLQNGSDLPSPDNVDVPIEIGSSLSSAPIDWPIVANPGDLFRIQVANADGTSNITIDTLKFSIA